MKFNQLKPIVLALSLSLVFAGCENNNQKEEPANKTEQNESVENTDKVDKEKTKKLIKQGIKKKIKMKIKKLKAIHL